MKLKDLKKDVVYEFNTSGHPTHFSTSYQYGLMILNEVGEGFYRDGQGLMCRVWSPHPWFTQDVRGATSPSWLIRPGRVASPEHPDHQTFLINGIRYLSPEVKEISDHDLTLFLGNNIAEKFSFRGFERDDVLPQLYSELLKRCNNV